MSQSKESLSWLKSIDQLSVPVSLTYKGDSSKSSRLGGFVSIFGIVLVFLFLVGTISMYVAFSNTSTNINIVGINANLTLDCSAENATCITVGPKSYMPFALLLDNNDPAVPDLSNYLVPEFYSYSSDGTTWYAAVSCFDLYEQIYGSFDEIPGSLWEVMAGIDWLCPDLGTQGNYTLANDPVFTGFGSTFNFVVNLCEVSQTLTDKTNCVTDGQTIVDYIYNVQVAFQIVHQYFSSDTYLASQTMDFTSDGKIFADFMQPKNATNGDAWITPQQTYYVQENDVHFFDSSLFDWSAFGSIAALKGIVPVAQLSYYTTLPQAMATKVDWVGEPTIGAYTVTLQQNMMMSDSDVSLLSLDSSLALVGGYAGTVWMIISCFCGGYSDFSYSNALVRDFVKRRKKNREN